MTILLGSQGVVELTRQYQSGLQVQFTASPVLIDVAEKQLILDTSELITGDRCTISSDGTLFIVRSPVASTTTAYVFNDGLGNLRFYDSYSDAIGGQLASALSLTASASGTTTITPVAVVPRLIGEVQNWRLNTNRASIDVTALGENFGDFEGGLITAEGTLDALFSYESCVASALEQEFYPDLPTGDLEPTMILHQLLLRLDQGGEFFGTFYMLKSGQSHISESATCLITSASVQCSGAGVITSSINFVTKGVIRLGVNLG